MDGWTTRLLELLRAAKNFIIFRSKAMTSLNETKKMIKLGLSDYSTLIYQRQLTKGFEKLQVYYFFQNSCFRMSLLGVGLPCNNLCQARIKTKEKIPHTGEKASLDGCG